MKPEDWGGVAAMIAAGGALLKWGDHLLAILTGRSQLKIEEGKSTFERAERIMDRQAAEIERQGKEIAALTATATAQGQEIAGLRTRVSDLEIECADLARQLAEARRNARGV